MSPRKELHTLLNKHSKDREQKQPSLIPMFQFIQKTELNPMNFYLLHLKMLDAPKTTGVILFFMIIYYFQPYL